jgi:hypothetical protein
MHYQVSRNGQTYGPYTLEDLQRYVASGNVLLSDLAKSDEMQAWVPVSQILPPPAAAAPPPASPAQNYSDPAPQSPGAGAQQGYSQPNYSQPNYAQPNYSQAGYTPPAFAPNQALAASTYPDAPNLHWALVALFTLLSCGFFMPIWNLVVAAWLKRVQPNAIALFLYMGVLVILFIYLIVGVVSMRGVMIHSGAYPIGTHVGLRGFIVFILWVVRLVARFSERASLEEHFNGPEPVGLSLNPVLTFFFGGIYFQSQLNRINALKQAARFGVGQAF